MNERPSLSNADEEILARFVGDLERQGEAVIEGWKLRHPHLASQFQEFVKFQDALADTRHEGERSVPARLGDFRMIRCIARGGMGEVWEAEQERLCKRRVAVKIIRRGRISDEARKRFLVEQEVLAKLHQTHIVPIFAAGDEGGCNTSPCRSSTGRRSTTSSTPPGSRRRPNPAARRRRWRSWRPW